MEVEQQALEREARIGELVERNQGPRSQSHCAGRASAAMSLDLATSKATAAALEAIIERIQGDVAELVTERRKKMQGPQAHGS
jgi:hypothetical protein